MEYGVGRIFGFLVFGDERKGRKGRKGEEVGVGGLMEARGGGRYGVTGAATVVAEIS